jgi:hypothetical protein
MSEVLSSYRSGRGPQDRGDTAYNIGTVVKPGPLPRSYNTGGGDNKGLVPKGSYLYPKPGISVFFYEDNQGKNRQLRNKDQVNHPMRTGDEFVGTATGETFVGPAGTFTKVDWVNSYVDHGLFGDKQVDTPRIGWVDVSKVTWQATAKSPGDEPADTAPITTGGSSGIDSTTLGFGAVAAALVFSMNKKKRRK